MVETYFVYIILLLICWLSAKSADRRNKKGRLLWAVFALTFIAGFRADSVGIDTANYLQKLSMIAQGRPDYAFGLETGFKYLCLFLLSIWDNSTFVLIVLALITNYCIIIRFWDFRKVSSLSCMVLCYYAGFFFMTMNVIRHFCAIAIIFYATRLISKRKYLRFLIVVAAVAFFFHQSAYICVVFLALEVLMWKELTKGQKHFLIACVLAVPVAFTYFMTKIAKYELYFESATLSFGLMLPLKAAFVLVTMLPVFKKREYKNRVHQTGDQSQFYVMSTANIYYLIGLALSGIGYVFPFMDRIGWYFYIFEGVYFGMLLKNSNKKNGILFLLCILFLMGYSFIVAIANGSQGVVPYLFIWQK